MITTTETPAKNHRVARCHGYFAWPGADPIGCPVCGGGLQTTTRQQRQAPWQILDREETRQASRLPGGLPEQIAYEREGLERNRELEAKLVEGLAEGRYTQEGTTVWTMREPYDYELAKGITEPQRSTGWDLDGLREGATKREAKIARLERKLAKLGGEVAA